MKITIFTPSYNRAYRLNDLYLSLLKQSFQDFEWIIIDDGSTDETERIVKGFLLDNKIVIRYRKQENKGKHVAINEGVLLAKGLLFFIVDSDDKLPSNALEIINNKFKNLTFRNGAGVVGRKSNFDRKIVGSSFHFEDKISNPIDIRFKEHLQGDLAEVFVTNILKKYPFPEFENERFCPEALIWNRIANDYDFLYFNESIYECEYLEDGLTSKIVKIRMRGPKASMLYYSELESLNIPFVQKIKANINFWRFSFNSSKYSLLQKFKKVNLGFTLIGLPLGFLLYLKDKKTT